MEKTITQFMNAWVGRNYKKMYQLTQLTWQEKNSITLLKVLLNNRVKKYEIITFNQTSTTPCICDVSLKIRSKGVFKELNARMIKEKAPYKPSLEGNWGVNPISLIKNLYN